VIRRAVAAVSADAADAADADADADAADAVHAATAAAAVAVAADAGEIVAIWNPVIRDTTITFTPDQKPVPEDAALIAGPDPVLVWDDGGMTPGFARYFQLRGGAGDRHTSEHTIPLVPVRRGRGGGRAAMTAQCDDAAAAGRHSLGVSAGNDAGVAFHSAVGLRTTDRLPEVGWKFGRWNDTVLMMKRLG